MSLYMQGQYYRDGEIPDMPHAYTPADMAVLSDGTDVEIVIFHTDKHHRGGLRCGYFGPAVFHRRAHDSVAGVSIIEFRKNPDSRWPVIGPNVVRDDFAHDSELWKLPGGVSAAMGEEGWLDVGGADGFGEDTMLMIRPAGVTGDPSYSPEDLEQLRTGRDAEFAASIMGELEQMTGHPVEVGDDGSIRLNVEGMFDTKPAEPAGPPARPQLSPMDRPGSGQ